jgi:type II restriction enzyme
MKPAFEEMMNSLTESNRRLPDFVDWPKVVASSSDELIYLNALNALIGQQDIRAGAEKILRLIPNCFVVLPMLIAVRGNLHYLQGTEVKHFDPKSLSSIVTVLEDSGLAKVLREAQVNSLADYFFGIEVGLDSNARKNRGGTTMEGVVFDLLSSSNKFKTVQKQVRARNVGLDGCFGSDQKTFDFCAETAKRVFLFEVNYYNGGGSKLNEVARAYKQLDATLRKRRFIHNLCQRQA